jgi:hypothetical protein
MVGDAACCVSRARRLESAAIAKQRRDESLVDPNEPEQQRGHAFTSSSKLHSDAARGGESGRCISRRSRDSALSHSPKTSRRQVSCLQLRTMTTISNPGLKRSRMARKASRTSRFARLRVGASPIFLDAVIPRRGGWFGASSRGQSRKTYPRVSTRRPLESAARNSRRFLIRADAGNRPRGGGRSTAPTLLLVVSGDG